MAWIPNESNKGLLLVNTGDGKGKTTAALGQAVRAAGQGLKVCIIQFIKGEWLTGEAAILSAFGAIDFYTMGSGFTWNADDKSVVIDTALQAWSFAKDMVMSDEYDLIVLDELTYLVSYDMISDNTLCDLVRKRPARLHLVVTGRNASPALIALADLVTEMKMVKHPYRKGVKAQKGIEF